MAPVGSPTPTCRTCSRPGTAASEALTAASAWSPTASSTVPCVTVSRSAALYQDGNVRIGQWGRDLTWSDDIVSVRQNAALLVEDCEVSPRTNEGNDTWGYVQVDSSEFITWRSAIGLTRNGDLLVAAGNSLSANSLAKALWAAGACWAMQLDINTPYVLASVFFQNPDGTIDAEKFMQSMSDNPARFLGTQVNDFMYVTLDETNYVPEVTSSIEPATPTP